MPLVKVWNDHNLEHVEKFKNQEIRIPPGGHILMDYIDAVDFRGQFFGMRMRGPNDPDPRFFKKIRVEEPAEPVVKADPNMMHATGKAAGSAEELLAALKGFAAAQPDLAVKEPELDKSLAEENAKLRAELAAFKDRKKPGPKPKERATA